MEVGSQTMTNLARTEAAWGVRPMENSGNWDSQTSPYMHFFPFPSKLHLPTTRQRPLRQGVLFPAEELQRPVCCSAARGAPPTR
jgi:hypothetical protein